MIHGEHVMSRSDASNYRPLATHVEETAARAASLAASQMRSNSSHRPPRRPIAIDSLGDDVSVPRDVSAETSTVLRRGYIQLYFAKLTARKEKVKKSNSNVCKLTAIMNFKHGITHRLLVN